MCIVVLPPFWLFQSASWWAKVPFLPPPRPWVFQVRAEVRFQARLSIAKSAPGFLQAKTTIHKNYLERYDVSKRILKTIELIERILNQCLTDLTSVDDALSYFRQNLGSFTMDNIADTGSIWMSANCRSKGRPR